MADSFSTAPAGGPAGGPAGRSSRRVRRPSAAGGRLAAATLAALGCGLAAGAGGCAASRTVVITATPPDAAITVDGVRQGTGTVTAKLRFRGAAATHTVVVSRLGYADQTLTLDAPSAAADPDVRVDLKPQRKKVWFDVRPLPAIVKVDGRPVGDGAAVSRASADLPFTVDAKDNWVTHVVSAERPGYRRAERVVRFTDPSDTYSLALEPERKHVVVRTDPPGADVTVDGELVGRSPVDIPELVIRTDPQTNEWLGRRVRAAKAGYEPAEAVVKWDDQQVEYAVKLGIKAKTVRVTTDPPDAVVRLGDRQLARDATGAVRLSLPFPPTNERGDLPTHELTVLPPVGNAVRDAAKLPIGWDDGRADYALALPAAPTKPTPLVRAAWVKAADGWRLAAQTLAVDAPVRTDERPGVRVTRVLPAPADGGVVDALATSPDGAWLAYAVLSAAGGELRSRLQVAAVELPARAGPASGPSSLADGPQMPASAAATQPAATRPALAAHTPSVWVTDGRSVAAMPSFAPDGLAVLYADSRDGGRTFGVVRAALPAGAAARGGRGDPATAVARADDAGPNGLAADAPPDAASQPLTAGEPADLWPTLDSAPQPRVYVLAMSRDDGTGRLAAVNPADDGRRTDLGQVGDQPRVSPRADAVVFTRPDPRTGKRDLFLLRMGADEPVNLTNSPDDDDADPAWSKDGGRLAFSSDRPPNGNAPRGGAPAAGPARDRNIWVLDVGRGDKPQRLTSNPAWDDSPAWNGDGTVLYFRSNRGGEWAVWALDLK